MFGIIDDNKKFILLDEDYNRLRTTALIAEMFTEENVDEAIVEYNEEDIEKSYDGGRYLKGYAPEIDNDYQSRKREVAYINEVDGITSHINRLKDKEQTPEVLAEIEKLKVERDEKVEAIKQRYPYKED